MVKKIKKSKIHIRLAQLNVKDCLVNVNKVKLPGLVIMEQNWT